MVSMLENGNLEMNGFGTDSIDEGWGRTPSGKRWFISGDSRGVSGPGMLSASSALGANRVGPAEDLPAKKIMTEKSPRYRDVMTN